MGEALLSSKHSASILEYYAGAPGFPEFRIADDVRGPEGFFRFGPDVVCYGQSVVPTQSVVGEGNLLDASRYVGRYRDSVVIPFDLKQVLENLRYERYATPAGWQSWILQSWVKDIYYGLRPIFPIWFRERLQRIYLSGWNDIRFPNWPVDLSADRLVERALVLGMRMTSCDRLPFIWFWPHGHKACAVVTHDVENSGGRDFCDKLMDIDDAFGFKASFQVVPERRYEVPRSFLQLIRDRGFEIGVHGLNHDGNLFQNRQSFLKSAAKINEYAREYGARGFRSPILYRNVDWFRELNFSYDMSVPNVARLEAQRGGCCTALPYFLPGGMLELPLTLTEDYSLFHILKDYSTRLWSEQIDRILEANGLINILVHPDYVATGAAQRIYKELLEILSRKRSEQKVWTALPRDVDTWWRKRSQMSLVPSGSKWKIEGPGSEQAIVAFACLDGDKLVYEMDSEAR